MTTGDPTEHDAAPAASSYTREEFTAWLAASCARQGVPVIITDPTVIAHVAILLGHHPHRRPRLRAQHSCAVGSSDAPYRVDAVEVQAAVQAHVGPLAA